ncbi:MAG: hypothetical protein ACI8R4_000458 [Paracoccaceae bacterium]|jgi:hypothetical protein
MDRLLGRDTTPILDNGRVYRENFYVGHGDDFIDGRGGVDAIIMERDFVGAKNSVALTNTDAGTIKDHFGDHNTIRNTELYFPTSFGTVFNGSSKDEIVETEVANNTLRGKGGDDSIFYVGTSGIAVNLNSQSVTNGLGKTDAISGFETIGALTITTT